MNAVAVQMRLWGLARIAGVLRGCVSALEAEMSASEDVALAQVARDCRLGELELLCKRLAAGLVRASDAVAERSPNVGGASLSPWWLRSV